MECGLVAVRGAFNRNEHLLLEPSATFDRSYSRDKLEICPTVGHVFNLWGKREPRINGNERE
jgi:hypothetical protein